jgi:hypothetical protein
MRRIITAWSGRLSLPALSPALLAQVARYFMEQLPDTYISNNRRTDALPRLAAELSLVSWRLATGLHSTCPANRMLKLLGDIQGNIDVHPNGAVLSNLVNLIGQHRPLRRREKTNTSGDAEDAPFFRVDWCYSQSRGDPALKFDLQSLRGPEQNLFKRISMAINKLADFVEPGIPTLR